MRRGLAGELDGVGVGELDGVATAGAGILAGISDALGPLRDVLHSLSITDAGNLKISVICCDAKIDAM